MSARTIVVPTPKSVLPQWNGHPVPWVTRWSGEVVEEPVQLSITREGTWIGYKDGLENRDATGLLWKREGLGRSGEPQFAQLNTYRQRACMTRRKCQICGSKINERPIRWLMSKQQLHLLDEGQALTMSPPTCASCIPLALELCPHLKASPHVILKVLEYEPWGVYGQAVTVDRDSGKGRKLNGAYVPFENPPVELTAVCAYQAVVRLTKFVIEAEE